MNHSGLAGLSQPYIKAVHGASPASAGSIDAVYAGKERIQACNGCLAKDTRIRELRQAAALCMPYAEILSALLAFKI